MCLEKSPIFLVSLIEKNNNVAATKVNRLKILYKKTKDFLKNIKQKTEDSSAKPLRMTLLHVNDIPFCHLRAGTAVPP